MFHGKFWITDTGECINVTGSEHAQYVKLKLLKLDVSDPHPSLDKLFKSLTVEEMDAAADRGVDYEVLKFFAAPNDARTWALEKWGWIRVRHNLFQARRLLGKEFELIRNCVEFWKQQTQLEPFDMLSFNTPNYGWETTAENSEAAIPSDIYKRLSLERDAHVRLNAR